MSGSRVAIAKFILFFPKKDAVLSINSRTDTIFHEVYGKHIVFFIAYGNNCTIT